MTEAWSGAILRASWQGGLLVAALWLLLRLWRGCPPETRTWLWLIAAGKFLLALLFVVPLPVLAPVALAGAVGEPAFEAITFSGTARSAPFDWAPLLLAAWSLCAVALVVKSVWDGQLVSRWIREARPAPECVAEAWQSVGGLVGASVLVHDFVPVPLVARVLRPVVLLPRPLLLQLSADELRMVLAHEAAHVRRRDSLASAFMFACHALFFFHPGVWVARREWRMDREAACDRSAMEATGADNRDYAAMLIKVSAGAQRAPALALSAAPTYRTLQRRINDMKNNKDKSQGRALWALLALLVSAAALPVVLVQRKPQFGAGVFQGAGPDVKVTQARKGASAKTDSAIAGPVRTRVSGLDQGGVASVAGQSAPAYVGGQSAPMTTSPGAPAYVGGQATAPASVSTGGVTYVGGQATSPASVSTGGVAYVGGQTAPSGAVTTTGQASEARNSGSFGGTTTAAGPMPRNASGQPGGATTAVGPVAKTTGVQDGAASVAVDRNALGGTAVTAPTMGTSSGLATIVLRDVAKPGGRGLDASVSLDIEDVDVNDFLKFLSSVSRVKISSKGVRSVMRLTARIENVTLGEVLGTLAKVYGLEWRLNEDLSITVSPYRK